jgi:hypothetical protein
MSGTVDIKGTIKRETEMAVLFEIDGEDHWIPFSLIDKITRNKVKEEDEIRVKEWFANKEGLI